LPTRSHLVRTVLASAYVWVIVGVPVATLIAACRVFVWVLTSLPEMIITAAVLGVVDGLWMHLSGSQSQANGRWCGVLSGGLLGCLGFPPVFSRVDGLVVEQLTAWVFFGAAIGGGLAAGFAATRVVTRITVIRQCDFGRVVVIGAALLLPLAGLDYLIYWPAVADRLPVRQVSEESIANIPPGDARGSTWTGCYEFLGTFSRGSGVVGKEGGTLNMTQTGGALAVRGIDATPFRGAVDVRGRFRFGGERVTGDATLRELWEGRFNETSLDFTRRITALRGRTVVNSTQVTGTAKRFPCTS
jgi:hypothetical protein